MNPLVNPIFQFQNTFESTLTTISKVFLIMLVVIFILGLFTIFLKENFKMLIPLLFVTLGLGIFPALTLYNTPSKSNRASSMHQLEAQAKDEEKLNDEKRFKHCNNRIYYLLNHSDNKQAQLANSQYQRNTGTQNVIYPKAKDNNYWSYFTNHAISLNPSVKQYKDYEKILRDHGVKSGINFGSLSTLKKRSQAENDAEMGVYDGSDAMIAGGAAGMATSASM